MKHDGFVKQVTKFVEDCVKNNTSRSSIEQSIRFWLSDKVSDNYLKYACWWWDKHDNYKMHIEVSYPESTGNLTIICPFPHLQRRENKLYENYDRAMKIIQ